MKNHCDILSELAALKAANKPAALVTVVGTKGSTPRSPGAKMIVLPSGEIMGTIGGANMEYKAVQESLAALKDGKPRKVNYLLHEEEVKNSGDEESTGMICGGEMELFIEPILSSPTLYLFGAGHVAQPTAKIAALCGFRIELFDHRSEMANEECFPDASSLQVGDLLKFAEELEPVDDGFAVVVTAGHDTDYGVMRHLLRKKLRYLGVISSERKRKVLFKKLLEEGYTQDTLDKIHMPIGLDIGSETPEEIAVSIIAELIRVKNLEK